MFGMNERKLSEEQKLRIEKIKEEWFAELDKIEPFNEKNSLSHSSNAKRIQLEKKYLPRIKTILEEE